MKRKSVIIISMLLFFFNAFAQTEKLLFGVAYYDEYMPYERLQKDVEMMQKTGINVVRIAESTWSTVEPQDNVWDFRSIDRVLEAMHKGGIKVIIGTPTYAIPTWLAKKFPSVLVTTSQGQKKYGARQNMDITNPQFRFYAERVIRKIMHHVKDHPAIIGYQIDNETKHYGTSGANVQKAFVTYIKTKYKTLNALNKAFGLDYWSNRINKWEDFPEINGTFNASINASLNSEFSKFQRELVTEYLSWQTKIVKEYAKANQFVTHNFDLDWRGYSYGIQTDVDHFDASKTLDISGIDIYHPTQDALTGIEISLGGDMARSMKNGKNYFVLETQAQGFPQWVPYLGQLRLQAFSHVASGANMVSYWHWHSIHNSFETYWKGLLSHDFEPNPTYNEAQTIGADFSRIGHKLVNLNKKNEVAIMFSNEAQTAFNAFSFGWGSKETYNDILRSYYDELYKMNVGVDFIDATKNPELAKYKLIIVPALYASPDGILKKLNAFVKEGGHILYTFKSGFSDENVKVRTNIQPGLINDVCGISYSRFTIPQNVSLKNDPFEAGKENQVKTWMELITPSTANVLAYYDHPEWGNYAAVTQNKYGEGFATYVGCLTNSFLTGQILKNVVKNARLWSTEQHYSFPIIIKNGVNQYGKKIHYIFNYSGVPQKIKYDFENGVELTSNQSFTKNTEITIEPWGVKIIEE